MFCYKFSKTQEKQYFTACEQILERNNINLSQLATQMYPHLKDNFISHQTLRNWWKTAGAIPSDIAVVLVDHFGAELVELCPWLEGHLLPALSKDPLDG